MTDVVDRATRSRMMSGIGPRDTLPEMTVRRYLHAAGLRFILHEKGLAGRPDLVFRKYRTVIFANGCFWHRHKNCKKATTPGTNKQLWMKKFDSNVARDKRNMRDLKSKGWQVLVIWECELRNVDSIDRLFWKIVGSETVIPENQSPENSIIRQYRSHTKRMMGSG